MWRDHPTWTLQQLADAPAYSVSWVKKWLRRFQEASHKSLAMFQGQSRTPQQRPHRVVDPVRRAILSLRDGLSELYGRIVGSKAILYHLHQDSALKEQGLYLPRSSRTIYRVLKEGGRIPTRLKEHHPIERPDPLQHWEMDFGAETALLAVARFLILNGLPQKLRLVGSWLTDGYPSALMRFLLCVGVEPDRVEPGKPQHKAFVERSIRTLKYECLWDKRPTDWQEAADLLEAYSYFYNQQRANQSLACGNRPPYEAFPVLPQLDHLPEQVDPDAWLSHFHGQVFRRRVNQGLDGIAIT